MLQDKYLPDYHFTEVHTILIRQSPEKIFPLVDNLNLRESWLINVLFAIRGIGLGQQKRSAFIREQFTLLEQQVDSEIILGLVGQFWKSDGNLQKVTPAEFVTFTQEGFLKATWNFKATPESSKLTLLETETRIKCLGKKAHRKFSFYWFFIRPFSGLIRKEILKLIKRKAEMM